MRLRKGFTSRAKKNWLWSFSKVWTFCMVSMIVRFQKVLDRSGMELRGGFASLIH